MDASILYECVLNCQDAHACTSALVDYCLKHGGRYSTPEHIGLLQDCSQICATSLAFLLRESPRHDLTCGACAAICTQCADECEHIGRGNARMLECAATCRECADTCNRMATSLRSVAYMR